MKKVAVVFAGCGSKDGAEITEAVSLMIALSQEDIQADVFAPNRLQHHVVNHATAEVSEEQRHILIEASRLVKVPVYPLESFKPENYDALCFGGGLGVAKNLCNYAFTGKDAILYDDVKNILLKTYESQKPIAAMCIAPVLLGLLAREKGFSCKITLGDGSAKEVILDVNHWNVQVLSCRINEYCIDEDHRFISVPAYMISNATPSGIFDSAKALVQGLKKLWKI